MMKSILQQNTVYFEISISIISYSSLHTFEYTLYFTCYAHYSFTIIKLD